MFFRVLTDCQIFYYIVLFSNLYPQVVEENYSARKMVNGVWTDKGMWDGLLKPKYLFFFCPDVFLVLKKIRIVLFFLNSISHPFSNRLLYVCLLHLDRS